MMVTVRDTKRDKIDAFSAGADDYVVKPFSTDELLARIQAALRRSHFGEPLPKIETPELKIDLESRDPAHPRYVITEPWFGYRFQIPNGTCGLGQKS